MSTFFRHRSPIQDLCAHLRIGKGTQVSKWLSRFRFSRVRFIRFLIPVLADSCLADSCFMFYQIVVQQCGLADSLKLVQQKYGVEGQRKSRQGWQGKKQGQEEKARTTKRACWLQMFSRPILIIQRARIGCIISLRVTSKNPSVQ